MNFHHPLFHYLWTVFLRLTRMTGSGRYHTMLCPYKAQLIGSVRTRNAVVQTKRENYTRYEEM
jgi:hypothetical protein